MDSLKNRVLPINTIIAVYLLLTVEGWGVNVLTLEVLFHFKLALFEDNFHTCCSKYVKLGKD